MIKVGIIGATGYAGGELVRILMGHKDVEIKWYGSRSYIDKEYASVYQNMFQIVDDILDVTSDSQTLGKPVGSDEENEKCTYVSLKGLEESKRVVSVLTEEAKAVLDNFNADTTALKKFADKMENRKN